MLIRILILALALAPPTAAYELGDTVADFTLPDLQGVERSFADLRGEVVVLNFFTTWCPGCNEEAESLQGDVWEIYADRGVRVLAVDIAEQPALVDGWRQALGLTYDIWMAPDWDLFALFTLTDPLPYNTVIDAEGVLRYASPGFDLAEILAAVEDLLVPTPAETSAWGSVKALYGP